MKCFNILIFLSSFNIIDGLIKGLSIEYSWKIERLCPDIIRRAVLNYVDDDRKLEGKYFLRDDSDLRMTLQLKFNRFYKKEMVLSNGIYFRFSNFKDVDNSAILDINLWLKKYKLICNFRETNIKINEIK